MIYEGGSPVDSALASGARGPGFNPRDRRGKLSVPEPAFLIVICSDAIKNSDRDINWRPLVHEENFPMQVKNTTIIFT